MIGRILRFVVVVVLGLATVGFGLCGALGVFTGARTMTLSGSDTVNYGLTFLGCGLVALAIAALCYWGFRRLQRPPPPGA
jgi:tellurite resistance protein TehA-like permease